MKKNGQLTLAVLFVGAGCASAAAPRARVVGPVAESQRDARRIDDEDLEEIDSATGLVAHPSLDDATAWNIDGILREPITIDWCPTPETCRTIVSVPAGARVTDYSSSDDGVFAVVWLGDATSSDQTLVFYEIATGNKVGDVLLHGSFPAPATRQARWTIGDNYLLTWSAGTNAAMGELFQPTGTALLGIGPADWIEVSPDGHTLTASDRGVTTYDLSTGVAIP